VQDGNVEVCFHLPVRKAVELLEDSTFVHAYAPFLEKYKRHDDDNEV